METLAFIIRVVVLKLILAPFLRLILGVKFRYAEKLSFDKPKIIVANHNSHIDAIAILCGIPIKDLNKVHPVVARDYFYKNCVTKFFAKLFLNCVSVSRNKQFDNPLAQCEKLLEQGQSLIIFPEGTRGEAGQLQKFRCGVSLLLKKFPETRFIPAYCEGFGDIMPKGDWLLIPFNSSIQFGKSYNVVSENDIDAITESIRNKVLALAPERSLA